VAEQNAAEENKAAPRIAPASARLNYERNCWILSLSSVVAIVARCG
jgi:hypothetical protein